MNKAKRRKRLGDKVRGNLGRLNAADRDAACRRACLDVLKFRARHDPLGEGDSAVECIPEAERDRRGASHRTRDSLDLLKAHNTISVEQYNAGRRFERDFRLAQLDGLRASPLIRMAAGTGGEMADEVVEALKRIDGAMAALGWAESQIGAAAWNILGLGRTVAQHAEASVLANGRSLERRVATGVFIGALGVLQLHYGERRKKTA